jgi:hypothetical protein
MAGAIESTILGATFQPGPYQWSADSQYQDGVPRGAIIHHTLLSRIFGGTERT